MLPLPSDYPQFLVDIKQRVQAAQYRALQQVNREQMQLIADRQQQHGWGKGVVETLARDLQTNYVGMSGFSVQHLWYMRLPAPRSHIRAPVFGPEPVVHAALLPGLQR